MSTPNTATTTATRPAKRPATTTATAEPTTPKATPPRATTPKQAVPKAAAPKPTVPKQAVPTEVTPLHAREPREVATATGLALAALVADAVAALGRLPRDAERLRDEVRPIAVAAPERLRGELERAERALSAAIDARAPRGRAVVDELVARPEVRELRERAEALRARLRRALGSADLEQR